jgi:hypothetical protein
MTALPTCDKLAYDAVALMIAAFIRSRPGNKKIMKEAAVPPIICNTAPKSVTCSQNQQQQQQQLNSMFLSSK